MTHEDDRNQKRWIEEADEALTRAGEALRAAWDQSRDARMAALETAKDAAHRLGEAIDQGIEAAKHNWDPSTREGSSQEGADAAETTATNQIEISDDQ
jgi:hypothetical protein